MITHKLIESHPEDSDVKIVFIGTKEECDKERSKYFLSPLSTLELTDEEFDIARKLFKDNRKNEYIWDGEKLICDNYNAFFPIIDTKQANVIIYPTEDATIEIDNDDQVDENTKFID